MIRDRCSLEFVTTLLIARCSITVGRDWRFEHPAPEGITIEVWRGENGVLRPRREFQGNNNGSITRPSWSSMYQPQGHSYTLSAIFDYNQLGVSQRGQRGRQGMMNIIEYDGVKCENDIYQFIVGPNYQSKISKYLRSEFLEIKNTIGTHYLECMA